MPKQQEIADCRKCGTSTGWLTANFVTLAGGYYTVLCQECRNDFHLWVENNPTWLAILDTNLQGASLVARTEGDGVDRIEEMRALAQQDRDLNSEMFHISKAWVLGEQAE